MKRAKPACGRQVLLWGCLEDGSFNKLFIFNELKNNSMGAIAKIKRKRTFKNMFKSNSKNEIYILMLRFEF
jgi:hypothetical protein